MDTIGKLIELALQECYERCQITWEPSNVDAPETFQADCEITLNRYWVGPAEGGYWNGDYHVILCGIYCLIDAQYLECWHSSKLEIEV